MAVTPKTLPPLGIADYALCCCLGRTREAVWRGLSKAEGSLGAPPFELPFASVCGVVEGPLPALPGALSDFDTRLARLVLLALEPLEPSLARLRARFGDSRVGIVVGSSTAGLDTTERAYAQYVQSGELPWGYSPVRQHRFGAVLAMVRELVGARGPALVVSTACSSSGKAFGTAQRMIAAGLADAMLVGGVDALCQMTVRGFRSLGILSEQPCRPFSSQRVGLNIGEGAAFFVLERGGDGPHRLLGVGESSDAHHMTAPDPGGRGAAQAMGAALALAGLEPDAIELINAHGTGTPLNDAAEATAIAARFPHAPKVLSTKGYTGHALGAAGGIEAALTLLSMEHGLIPQSRGCEPVDPELDIAVVEQASALKVRRALSNSFAFGGSNVSVVLEHTA
ncbi:MAG: beta-ketoacyl-ACP synthase [Myxococcales bacterium]|nr:beta-ketoacyl-ACP synthase [Myxococcales bacterium]